MGGFAVISFVNFLGDYEEQQGEPPREEELISRRFLNKEMNFSAFLGDQTEGESREW